MSPPKERVRIAAIGDLHYARPSQGTVQPMLARIADEADILLICGDLTDYGLPEEARLLAREIAGAVKIPIVAVIEIADGQLQVWLDELGCVAAGGSRPPGHSSRLYSVA